MPESKTLQTWKRQVPGDFVFAVKASRYITHMIKLKEPGEALEKFLGRISDLNEHLGPILFQLPPRWSCNAGRLHDFLDLLPSGPRYTLEFRDDSWWNKEVLELLQEKNAAFCIYDLNGRESPRETSADFVYIRLHGPGQPYQGRYGPHELSGWAGAISTWSRSGKEVYCYFDNDDRGYAAEDAVALHKMLSKHGSTSQ